MLSDSEFRMILDYFDRPWKGYRRVRRGVKKRIRRHMAAVGCTNAGDYLAIVSNSNEQRAIAEACLLVTISRFFRDRLVWESLGRTVLTELVEGGSGRVRAWSAGCACGEEAYTLSILWHGLGFPRHKRLEILATDVESIES